MCSSGAQPLALSPEFGLAPPGEATRLVDCKSNSIKLFCCIADRFILCTRIEFNLAHCVLIESIVMFPHLTAHLSDSFFHALRWKNQQYSHLQAIYNHQNACSCSAEGKADTLQETQTAAGVFPETSCCEATVLHTAPPCWPNLN